MTQNRFISGISVFRVTTQVMGERDLNNKPHPIQAILLFLFFSIFFFKDKESMKLWLA